MSRLQIVQARKMEGFNTKIVCLPFRILSQDEDFSFQKAVKDAVQTYLATESGARYLREMRGTFDWFDFDAFVPNSICRLYGFEKVEESNEDIEVDGTENLR